MTLYRWGFEGQTSGVAPTAANADDFGDPTYGTAVSITGSAVVTYSNAHPMVGTMGMLVSAAAGEVGVLRSPTWTATTSAAFQEYIYLTAYPSVTFGLAQWRTSGSINQCTAQMDSSGRMFLLDNSGSSPSTLLRTAVIPLNTAYRYDALATIGTTNANSSFKHKLTKVSDNSTLDEQTSTALNLNNAAVSPAILVSGQHGKPNSAGTISGLYIDSPAWQDAATNYITPPSTALAVTGSFAPSSGTAPLSGTLSLTPSGGTGTTITYVIQWGDGSTDTTTTSTTATHTYSSPGTYTWTATATNA